MNLLIVDDEIVTTQVLEEQLDRELLSIDQIYVAYNTSMARDILQKNKVELILCDIEMPKENGIHFLKWVREQKIQTEVIFLTSHEKFEYAYGAVQNGAANYLLKPIDMNKINQTLLRVTEKIVWKQKTEEIREYWESGIRKMVRYFWTRVLLEPGVQKQGLEEEIKQQGIEEEIQEKYCVVILHFASGKLDLGKEKGQESIYKFAMENILAEAFTEKIKMENVICWEENKGTYLGILSEFSEKETKERAEQVRNIFEKYFPETLQIGYISPSVPFYEVGLEKEKIMEKIKDENVFKKIVQCSEYIEENGLTYITIDHKKAAYEAVSHLISIGKKDIYLFSMKKDYTYSTLRREGLIEAMKDNGLEFKRENEILLDELSIKEAQKHMNIVLNNREVKNIGIFAVSDVIAIGVIKALNSKNIKIPQEAAVVGFDNIDFSAVIEPSLTTVSQPGYELGVESVKSLMRKITGENNNPEKIILDYELIVRETTNKFVLK